MMQTQAGDDLIGRILTHSSHDDVVGPAANELLSQLFAGYPVDNLGRLLHSGDDATVRTGTWLLSELGDLATPLMDEVPALLSHPHREVRFFAVEVVLTSSDSEHGPVIAQAINMISDYDEAIRWKVVQLLAAATADQLEAGESCLQAGPVKKLTEWLVRQETEEPDARDVIARLHSSDPASRLFALAAAARLSEEDSALLEQAATVEDEEIRSFAELVLSELG
ncbi:hypothetical protein FE391_35320 [Nonomuraea sp. KC401]|uniref:hypothetical protein n=1 Tax=unclassified Nonomuraea TaxID=2593643 RepID=UPI0010FE45DB|nr:MULTISPECIES: hypothetical protein [unclassified Nonomuraea]NBE98875.1 hypothetical protein [Nonomuraea sp. K271]TLF59038.1 hypothetical protein FE391_35320 [Nonomuraea sp. KC401]